MIDPNQNYDTIVNDSVGIDKVTSTISNTDLYRISRRRDMQLCLLDEVDAAVLEEKRQPHIIAVKGDPEELSSSSWTDMKLVDMIFQDLANVKILADNGKGKTFEIPKYGEEVIYIAPKIAILEPVPELVINISDLNEEILRRLHSLDNKQRDHVLLHVGRKLFKTFFPHYFNEVADLISVRIDS